MKKRLSTEEMLMEWRMRRALEPLRSDCTVTRIDGIDIDAYLKMEMHNWYLNLLDTAPPHMLTVTDIASTVEISTQTDYFTIALPTQCRRVIELHLSGCHSPAIITEAGTPIAVCQQNEFSRGGNIAPIAIMSHRQLTVFTSQKQPSIDRLLCIMEPETGYYELDEKALALITPTS